MPHISCFGILLGFKTVNCCVWASFEQAAPLLMVYLVDTVLRAEVPGRKVGSYGEVLLVHDDSAIPQQRQPC